MGVKVYTREQDLAILAASTRPEMEALSVRYGKPWRTLREHRRVLRRCIANGRSDLPRPVRVDKALSAQMGAGRPAWFQEDVGVMMKAGR